MSSGILPTDDSDFSMPGRLEEGSQSVPARTEHRQKSHGLVIAGIIFGVVAAGFFAYYFANQDAIDSEITGNTSLSSEQRLVSKYNVGGIGSDHAHAAIGLFIHDRPINFGAPEFQLQSRYIHFEDHNPYMIHKHATNVPLEILFESIGLRLTPECIVAGDRDFCNDSKSLLTFAVNGEYKKDITGHVIKQGDRILISYGNPVHIKTQLQYIESLEIFEIPEKDRRVPGKDFRF